MDSIIKIKNKNNNSDYLKKLSPVNKTGEFVYLFKSENNYKIGYNKENKFFLQPLSGKAIIEDETIDIIETNGQVKKVKVKNIQYTNIGHIVTFLKI